MSVGSQLQKLPIGEMIASLATGIAQAQIELDEASMRIAQLMSGFEPQDRVLMRGKTYSLIELGLTPTFYHFTETTLEVKMSISMTIHGKGTSDSRVEHSVNSVDASFASKFQYSIEGSSLVRTRLVPIPPPQIFQERVERMIEGEREFQAQTRK